MKMIFLLLACIISMAVNAQDSTYKELVGKYKFPSGSVVEEVLVTLENGAINMNSTAGISLLEKIKGDTFNIISFNGIAVFTRNEAKKITGVHIDASGYVLDGVKEAATIAAFLNEGIAAGAVTTKAQLRAFIQPVVKPQRREAFNIYN
ncbi:MAG: hypothetical protein ABIQ88_06520 [Chitinophagaceae bacterium]